MLKKAQFTSGDRNVHLGGWRKQPHDGRDHHYAIKLHASFTGGRPTAVDNRGICSPIEDQGQLGSCTAHMMAALVEANENRRLQQAAMGPIVSPTPQPSVVVSGVSYNAQTGTVTYSTTVTPAPTPAPAPTPTPTPTPKLVRASRLFEYYATRKIEGTVTQDAGATIRDAVKAGAVYGIVDESLYPYQPQQFAVNPPAAVWSAAATHKVTSYHAITDGDIETMKSVLSAPVPFLIGFGFSVYDAFLGPQVAQTGLLCRPTPTEQLQGGHAVALVGYDDNKVMPDGSKGAFIVRNSWGTGWGYQGSGYFWMAQNYVADTSLASDFWVVQSAPI